MIWKNIAAAIGLAGACCILSAPGASAQGGPGAPLSRGQNPPGGPRVPGGPMPPEMQAKMKAWQKWSDSHKGIADLQTLLRKVEQLDKEPGAALNKQQAARMLAIIKPWRTKSEMTNEQANGLMKSVTGVLTPAQVAKLATMQGRRGGMGMGGMGGGRRPGGMGGPGGGPGAPGAPRPGTAPTAPGAPGGGRMGGPGGGRMGGGPGGPGGFKIPDPPKNGYNPLNPATLPFEQLRPRAQKNLDDFMAALQAKAK